MIEKLPNEVITQIVDNLDQRTLLKLSLTSSKLHIFANQKLYGKVWICLYSAEFNGPVRFIERFSQLSYYTFSDLHRIKLFFNDKLFKSENASYVKELYIMNMKEYGNKLKINNHLKKLVNLEKLTSRDCGGSIVDTEHVHILEKIKPFENHWNTHFRSLNIEFSHLVKFSYDKLHLLNSIEDLNINVYKIGKTSQKHLKIFESFTSLNKLIVSNQFIQFFSFLNNSKKIKYDLKNLVLIASIDSEFDKLELTKTEIKLISKLINLQELNSLNFSAKDLGAPCKLEELFFQNLQFPKLTEFSYESSDMSVPKEFYPFLKNLTLLKKLNIDTSESNEENTTRKFVYSHISNLPPQIEYFNFSNFFRCDLPKAMYFEQPATINIDQMIASHHGQDISENVNCTLKEKNQDIYDMGLTDLLRVLVIGDSNKWYGEFNELATIDETFFWKFMVRPRIAAHNCIGRLDLPEEDCSNILSILVGIFKHLLQYVLTKYKKLKYFTLGGIQFKVSINENNERFIKFTNFENDLVIYETDISKIHLPQLEYYEPSEQQQNHNPLELMGLFHMLRHFQDGTPDLPPGILGGLHGMLGSDGDYEDNYYDDYYDDEEDYGYDDEDQEYEEEEGVFPQIEYRYRPGGHNPFDISYDDDDDWYDEEDVDTVD